MHTRWIETDFANTLAAAPRSEPPPSDAALVRTAIEVDGRRVALGLPASLLQGLQAAGVAVGGDGASAGGLGSGAASAPAEEGAVIASVAGNLQAWKVADGDEVAEGDTVAMMEAMKMEMPVTAHRAGRIALKAVEGAAVAAGAAIAVIGWRVTV